MGLGYAQQQGAGFACPLLLPLILRVGLHHPRAAWVAELFQGFRLNLANPLPGDAELLANFFQSMVTRHPEAKAHTQDPLFTWCQG